MIVASDRSVDDKEVWVSWCQRRIAARIDALTTLGESNRRPSLYRHSIPRTRSSTRTPVMLCLPCKAAVMSLASFAASAACALAAAVHVLLGSAAATLLVAWADPERTTAIVLAVATVSATVPAANTVRILVFTVIIYSHLSLSINHENLGV